MSGAVSGRRVVISGCGAITPLGLSVEALWEGLLAGRSGIGPVTSFDATSLSTRIAGEVRGFDPQAHMPPPVARRTGRFTQYAYAAAVQAVRECGLPLGGEPNPRLGVVVGTGYGADSMVDRAALLCRERGVRALGGYFMATGSLTSPVDEIALRLRARGPSAAVSTACAAGTTAVGEGARLIRDGTVDIVVAVGTDDPLNLVDMGAACTIGALSRRNDQPSRASRPFDRERDGFVMAGGAGAVVLEEAGHAGRRGARVLAEIAGYGASTDAHHLTSPHPEGAGALAAMRAALRDAGLTPDDVDHVNAHGTGTVLNDRIETAALRQLLGTRAERVPVCSVKSMTGHMIAGSGAVETVVAVHTLLTGVVPPTANCETPEDPTMNYVAHAPQEAAVDVVLSNSFGFGGHNACLVLRRWQG